MGNYQIAKREWLEAQVSCLITVDDDRFVPYLNLISPSQSLKTHGLGDKG
jgi:hypothetical protein